MLSFYLSLIDNEDSKILFEQLYHLHRHTMIYAANQILHDQMLAEDATHDAFMHILNNLDKIEAAEDNRTRAFVIIIVKNIALDYLRKHKRQSEMNIDDYADLSAENQYCPENDFIQAEDYQSLAAKIGQLHPAYANILSLKIAFNLSDQEISQTLGISPTNVRVRLHRARCQLGLNLEKDDASLQTPAK